MRVIKVTFIITIMCSLPAWAEPGPGFNDGFDAGASIKGVEFGSAGIFEGNPFKYVERDAFCTSYRFVKFADLNKFPLVASDSYFEGFSDGAQEIRVHDARHLNVRQDIADYQNNKDLKKAYVEHCAKKGP